MVGELPAFRVPALLSDHLSVVAMRITLFLYTFESCLGDVLSRFVPSAEFRVHQSDKVTFEISIRTGGCTRDGS